MLSSTVGFTCYECGYFIKRFSGLPTLNINEGPSWGPEGPITQHV